MDTRRRWLAVGTIVLGIVFFVIVVFGVLSNQKPIVSPVPEESGIKIIFLTPTPTGSLFKKQ